ncbi:VanZ family protein [Spongiivirga citrea]|uniref:VanZ family protein n=1 Tax=Spongiivirga citrea TaxID=1481457 RepID=A0A6M0CK70_9FLAO|nr:VanZ family protein [Spongiivirga citrea]
MVRKIGYWLLAIGWTVLITYLSLTSFDELEDVDGIDFIDIPHSDKIGHFIFYFGCTTVWFLLLFKGIKLSNKVLKILAVVAIGSFLYGVLIEILQANVTTTRSGDWRDALANTTGILVACFIISRSKLVGKR